VTGIPLEVDGRNFPEQWSGKGGEAERIGGLRFCPGRGEETQNETKADQGKGAGSHDGNFMGKLTTIRRVNRSFVGQNRPSAEKVSFGGRNVTSLFQQRKKSNPQKTKRIQKLKAQSEILENQKQSKIRKTILNP
jgi:hypothetical protein